MSLCGDPLVPDSMAMVIEENVSFISDGLALEGVLSYDQELSHAPGVILCPPHPHLGGDMNNNVIMAVQNALSRAGVISLRFNYRGVGNSQRAGVDEKEDLKAFWENSWAPDDEAKEQDVLSAINFLRGIQGLIHDQVFLVGYSFGSYLALRAAEKCPMVKALVLISPTVHFHDFTYLNYSSINKLVVSSNNDFSCPLEELMRVYDGFSSPKGLYLVDDADHFFIGCEDTVSKRIEQFIVEQHAGETANG